MDPYSANPLAEWAQETDPRRYAEVSAVKAPPKMFANGTADVPAFTASGIDPQHLLRLPVGVRHAAAANPDVIQVYRWFEDYGDISDAEIDHDGWRAARSRMTDWLTKTDLDTRTPEQKKADEQTEWAAAVGLMLPEIGREETRQAERAERWEKKQDLTKQLKELDR